jgi:hypothetical protein
MPNEQNPLLEKASWVAAIIGAVVAIAPFALTLPKQSPPSAQSQQSPKPNDSPPKTQVPQELASVPFQIPPGWGRLSSGGLDGMAYWSLVPDVEQSGRVSIRFADGQTSYPVSSDPVVAYSVLKEVLKRVNKGMMPIIGSERQIYVGESIGIRQGVWFNGDRCSQVTYLKPPGRYVAVAYCAPPALYDTYSSGFEMVLATLERK